LQESIIGVLLFPIPTAIAHLGWTIAVLVGVLLARALLWIWPQHHPSLTPVQIIKECGATLVVTALVSYAVLLTWSYGELRTEASQLGKLVRGRGVILASWVNRGKTERPVLDLLALPADIIVKKDAHLPTLTPECVLYLGQADGQAVLFDARQDLLVRLSLSDFTIVTHPRVDSYELDRQNPKLHRLTANCSSG
jgi:hypothetical protein